MKPVKVKLVNTEAKITSSNINSLNNQKIIHNIDLEKSMATRDSKAYEENPIRMMQSVEYKDKPTSLSYNILYQMSVKNSVVAAVINTRVNQVSAFTKPKRFSTDGLGFEVRLRNPNQTPNQEQKNIINALELFLENCGFSEDPKRDSFDTFIRKLVRDSLTYDQMTFEIVPDRRGKPAEILAVDASTIRAATENYTYGSSWGDVPRPKKGEEVSWVQVIDGSVVSWFASNELAFGVRNPRTNVNIQPYGFSELEMLIQQITSHLYAEEYNSKFFSQGGTTKGIINIKSDPNGIGNTKQLESFKRQWQAQVNGMSGAWKTPVLQVPDGVEYVNVSQSNREMEFNQWINYLINIVCAVYAIDPAEINFSNNGGATSQSSVFETSQEQKLKNSKDKGLKPLLRFIEATINKNIISRFSKDYVFSFTGLDEHSEEEKADLDSKQVKVWKTINEIRKEHGEEPIEHGDIILDSSFINYIQNKENQEQMAQQGDMGAEQGDMGGQFEGMDEGQLGEVQEGEEGQEPTEQNNSYEAELNANTNVGENETEEDNDITNPYDEGEEEPGVENPYEDEEEQEEEKTNKSLSRSLIITIE